MRAFSPRITRESRMSGDAAPGAPPSIDQIIQRCLSGDQAAWEAIVRLYRRKVFNIAYTFVGTTTERRT